MLFYFTATGNSLYVAKRLDPRCISIAQAVHDDPQPYQDAQIGIVCPVHAQQIPELVSTFLHDAYFDTPYFYMILTYGSHYGKAPQQAFELALRLGINPAYINAVMMADSFLPAADIEKEMAADKHISAQIDAIRTDLTLHLAARCARRTRALYTAGCKEDHVRDQRRLHRMRDLQKDLSDGSLHHPGAEKPI